MRDLIESAEVARGYHCPHCGGPLTWVHERRFSPALGEETYQRGYLTFRDSQRRCRTDREVEVPVARVGHEMQTRTAYERRLELVCPRCNVIMSRGQAAQGDPAPRRPEQGRIPRIGGRV